MGNAKMADKFTIWKGWGRLGKAGDAYHSAGINKRQGKALDLLMKKDLMHVSGLEEICPKVTRRTLQRDLNNLIELNLVRLKGAARQSNYELAK
jgi:hypothetical protein